MPKYQNIISEFFKRALSGFFITIWIFFTLLYSSTLFIISMITCLILIALFEWPKIAKDYQPLFFIYPTIPFLLLLYLQIFGYKTLNILIFASSFLFDTSAYIFGKLFGKHKIAPTISPGKTIEGSLGGLLIVLIAYIFFIKYKTQIPLFPLFSSLNDLLIPTAISLSAFAGDLFESYLKRESNLKDSGSILPGHGGLLDRFDSILFVTIFAFIFRKYLAFLLNS